MGSYSSLDGGKAYSAAKALTRAPVEIYFKFNRASDDETWHRLVEAVNHRWPIVAAFTNNTVGIMDSHAFAVLGTKADYSGHGRAVHIYNPHGQNYYQGSLSNQRHDQGGY